MRDKLKVKKLRDGARIPAYATDGSAGLDLVCASDAPVVIRAGERESIPTGIAVECSRRDAVLLVFARSGLATKHGISLANGVGVVDPDYRGEIIVSVINTSREDYTVSPGERIAQLVVVPFVRVDVAETDELSETARGAGGFGSTGKS
ncbi:MAG: dUTP diphosphatase [Clostridia bacterium]|nr:dUTP diphosphatase [Clostridia bacterium]